MKNGKKAVALAVLLGLAGQANAGFEVVKTSEASGSAPAAAATAPAAAPVAAPLSAGVRNIGVPAAQQPVVKGFAKEISLLTALKQIVPQGWKAKKVGSIDIKMPVSWKGEGRAWTDVLQTMAIAHGISATLDWEKKELTVAAAEVASPAAGEMPSAPAAPVVSAPAQAAVAGPKAWLLTPDLTLKENVMAWAKTAGWEVSWGAVDYPVVTQVTLTGELDAEDGPIHQLALAYSKAEQPLTFSFWTNKVIRVENAAYKPLAPSEERPNHRVMQ